MIETKLKKAFTLAEVLLVIAIIGIITSIVLVTLQHNIDSIEKRAKLNVVRSVITQAIIQYQAKNICSGNLSNCEPFTSEALDIEAIYDEVFKDELKIQKNCGLLSGQGCFAKESYKDTDGQEVETFDNSTDYYKVVLQNNITIGFAKGNLECKDNICLNFVVDTNGPTPPNTVNRDTFKGVITENIVKIDVE